MAIVLPTGRGELHNCERMSPARHTDAPYSRLNGSVSLIADLPLTHLVICGAIIPTNPTGPQNAVAAPVRMQQLRIDTVLVLLTFWPLEIAKSSPNSNAVKPLWLSIAAAAPAVRATAIVDTPVQVLPEKLPAAQFQYIFTLVSSA